MLEKCRYIIPVLLVLCMGCYGCSPRALHEAQEVVAEADSLWQAGQAYSDSTRLAQAYKDLGRWQWFYSDEYAHACYHYGRLLRAHDDPVAAMQVFIDATHSRTHDYHILGRVYSNMGSICHLAEEFALSYDMYERSGGMYLRNGDTLLYYYDLNNMAFELAEQGEKEETLTLVSKIEEGCTDEDVLSKTWETKARLYLKCEQYDSALYYAYMMYHRDTSNLAVSLMIAQSYSYISKKDSATVYANKVLSKTNDKYEESNALYILTNDDETRDKHLIRAAAADRADAQKIIEIRRGKLSQAVQLLEQDINRKPNLIWLYVMIGTLGMVSCFIVVYVQRKRKNQSLLTQQIENLETAYNDLQAERARRIEHTCAALRASSNMQQDLCWKDFDMMCHFANEHFYLLASKLQQKEVLNETEIRLCILVLIGLSRAEIAHTLPYSLNSIGKLKDHTAKLLGTTGKNLRDFLLKVAIEG